MLVISSRSCTCVQDLIDQYATENLVGETHLMNILERVLDMTATPTEDNPVAAAPSDVLDAEDAAAVAAVRRKQLEELATTVRKPPNVYQKRVLTRVLQARNGLFVISGGPGTGKTFVTKHIIHDLRKRNIPTVSSCSPLGKRR